MKIIRYCSPQWLEKSAELYRADPEFEEALSKLSTNVFFRIKARPDWGIEQDILFSSIVDKGKLIELKFVTEEEAYELADFILSATPDNWKKLLRKDIKFTSGVMTGKIGIEHGSKVGVLGLAPYASYFIKALTQFNLQFPDEMSQEELEQYGDDLRSFRAEAKV
jgi:putative sterol carrier protein